MLEEKLVDLQIQISALTIAIKNLTLAVTRPVPLVPMPEREQQADPEPAAADKPKPAPTPLATSAKKASIEIADNKIDAVSIDVLRDMCMGIVRADPSRKAEVIALIKAFGGAEKVQDVPVENRLELLKALEQL
jgi:hypothetical protein